jgi:hypothetical protein
VKQIGVAWAELVSLGSFIEQDDELREQSDTFIDPLELDIRRSLVDLIQTAGPWLRRFPTVLQLDDELASFQTPRAKVPSARTVLAAIKEGRIVRDEDVSIIEAGLTAGEHSGYQSSKARSWSIVSVRNVVVVAAGFLASNLAAGIVRHIGEQVAKHSSIVEKTVAVLTKEDEVFERFISDLPADIRAAIRTLIKDLKNRANQPFPLPKAPRLEPNDPTSRQRKK